MPLLQKLRSAVAIFPQLQLEINFFVPRKVMIAKAKEATSAMTQSTNIEFCKSISKLMPDSGFSKQHKNKNAPPAMIALAAEVVNNVMRSKDKQVFEKCFSGLTMVIPKSDDACNNPHCYSIIGQKLLLVDWSKAGVSMPCPDACYNDVLNNVRTNFSKNKTLFPIFGMN